MIETISGLGELGTMFASIQTEHIRENTPIDTGMVSQYCKDTLIHTLT